MTIQKQLGMRIKYLRKLKKLSQEDLALDSNINKNYLCDLENGKRNPTLDILQRLANGLEISLEELFKGLEEFEE